ncbi:MAG: hypothetical protein HY319_17135 [Armatimonadetes bacterium]|nr:hypothetical protein [Armatimonadota bacterium]
MSQLAALLEKLRRKGRLESSGRFALPLEGGQLLELAAAALESGAAELDLFWDAGGLRLEQEGAIVGVISRAPMPERHILDPVLERLRASPIRIDFNRRRISTGLSFSDALVCRELGPEARPSAPFQVARKPRGLVDSRKPAPFYALLSLGRRLFTATAAGTGPPLLLIRRGVVFPKATALGFPSAAAAVDADHLALDRTGLDVLEDDAYRATLDHVLCELEDMARELRLLAEQGPGSLKALAQPVLDCLGAGP